MESCSWYLKVNNYQNTHLCQRINICPQEDPMQLRINVNVQMYRLVLLVSCKSDQYSLSSDSVKWIDKEKSNCNIMNMWNWSPIKSETYSYKEMDHYSVQVAIFQFEYEYKRPRYGSHRGSLFHTEIKFDSQIFSSAPQILSLFPQVELKICGAKLKICESNSIPVQKGEPPWLPYSGINFATGIISNQCQNRLWCLHSTNPCTWIHSWIINITHAA